MMQILLSEHPILFYLFYATFSLCIGSLLNVIIYRLPIMLQAEWKEQCELLFHQNIATTTHKMSLFFPRSFCPHCQNKIPFWHTIPLLSYLFLRGRCHHCHSAISWQYPLVEGACLILSCCVLWRFGLHMSSIFALLFCWIMICIFVIDLQKQLILDNLSLSLLWLGLLANTQALFTPLSTAVFSAVGAYIFLWLFITLYYLITKKIGMGHGDFKLFSALGAWFGVEALPWILLCSAALGGIVGIFYLIKTKQSKDTPIPFGPFLCITGIFYLITG